MLRQLSALLLVACATAQAEQVVLSSEPGAGTGASGVLRRFNVPIGLAEALLVHAQENDWDVWHATPSSIDVYFPFTAPSPSSIYSNFTDTPISAPPPQPQSTRTEPWDLTSLTNASFHTSYRTLDEIYSFMHDLSVAHPDTVRIVGIGHSAQGREMYALEISSPDAADGGEYRKRKHGGENGNGKIGFALTGAQHAREWVATATAVYLAHALVADSSEAYSLSPLLDDFNFYIVPVPNPDGYLYTWETDRFWYKNRQTLAHGALCTGLDMNRNWGYKWKANSPSFGSDLSDDADADLQRKKKKDGKKGGKKKPQTPPADPCSHWYPGARAFQSPEVSSLATYLEIQPNLRAYLDLRSYGQMLSTPFSFSCSKTPRDAEDMLEAAHGAAFAVKTAHGAAFTTGSLCETLYKAGGNVVDWMYKILGVRWSFAVHLRDTGTYGFMLPPEWIRVVGEETSGMVSYLAKFVAGKELGK
ncbi:peptidase M14 [Peniophora sp. CONT]|nr:peptidase M14 [Peniophora sp. CONT]